MNTYAYQLIHTQQRVNKPIVCILENALSCEQVHRQLRFFATDLNKTILHLPSYELNEDDLISPSANIVSQRISSLYALANGQFDILLVSADAALHLLPPQDFVALNALKFKQGQKIEHSKLLHHLTQIGFERCSQVNQPMQFAQRGEVFDLFLPQFSHPHRLILDDDIIESIRKFDPESQRSFADEAQITLSPTLEYDPATALTHIKNNQITCAEHIKTALKQQHTITAWQRHLHTLHPQLVSLLDYIPKDVLVFGFDSADTELHLLHANTNARMQSFSIDANELLLSDTQLHALNARIEQLKNNTSEALPDLNTKDKDFKAKIDQLSSSSNLVFVCQNHFRSNELEHLLLTHQITYQPVDSWIEAASKTPRIAVCIGELSAPLYLAELKQWLIPEHALSHQVATRTKTTNQTRLPFDELNVGDLLIHEDHGIGKFIGIESRYIEGQTHDFVTIAYANDDKLLFPPNLLYKLHPYQGEGTPLDNLKSDKWAKRKKKAAENIELLSAKLLQTEAQRKQLTTEPFSLPSEYKQFTDKFPFVDTPDQSAIMQAIIKDFQSNHLFDRLVCGDVGFGKTEIALRSAFIAVMNSKQVLLLAPTTVLANQHFNTFQDRFSDWPVNIALMTRANQKSQADISAGKIDIIIATHKGLNLNYHSLGLLIIDEEHRFGVKQKDSMEALAGIHRISLSATPIPRSLNMALSKFRSISMMHTPPQKRLPIITEVAEESDALVKSAIERELRRGGQIYVLVNEISKIPEAHQHLKKLCPTATFGTLHGQMRSDAIERQMARFYAHGFNILIASTIIESGIDIANANTLIVYRADKLGLAQLHQLRGRIGRSHHQGFAYFLTPDGKKITKDAQMRLDAITNHSDLGAGFKLALADLEIRGAGNLLGAEQSGHINAIGLSLFTTLLKRALPTTKSYHTEVKSTIAQNIPEAYIESTALRYQFYHKIANASSEQDILSLIDELIDRFGKLPESAQNIIQAQRIKIAASEKQIKSVYINEANLIINFGDQCTLNTAGIVKLLNEKTYQLAGPTSLKVSHSGNCYQAWQQLLRKLVV